MWPAPDVINMEMSIWEVDRTPLCCRSEWVWTLQPEADQWEKREYFLEGIIAKVQICYSVIMRHFIQNYLQEFRLNKQIECNSFVKIDPRADLMIFFFLLVI